MLRDINFKELFLKFRYPLLILLVGLILAACGAFFIKSGILSSSSKVEVLQATTSAQVSGGDITAEIAGEVIKPGVYKLPAGSRVDDLLTVSGGLTAAADRVWTNQYLNRAAKLTDGQKVYIPSVSQQPASATAKNGGGGQTASSTISSDSNTLININTGSAANLDSLPGIGPVYAQNIVEHRPYSTLEELVSKGAIKQSLYDKIKNLITIY